MAEAGWGSGAELELRWTEIDRGKRKERGEGERAGVRERGR